MELEALLDFRPSLEELMRQMCLESEWYQIGVRLDLNPGKLSAIRFSAVSERAKTSDMYKLWLDSQPQATRRQLIEVLESMNLNRQAHDYKKYLKEAGLVVRSNEDQNIYLLDKKPQTSDLMGLFKSSAAHFAIIGTVLDVDITDLLGTPMEASHKLVIVFQRWMDSNNDVTWRKVLQVYDNYPEIFGKVKADVKKFLLSDEAHNKYNGHGRHVEIQPVDVSSNKPSLNNQSSDENILNKEPKISELLRLFKSSAAHHTIIGTALDVKVNDLLPTPGAATNNLTLVFQRWKESKKEVTWRKVLQVCENYPEELGSIKAEVQRFLSLDRARDDYGTPKSSDINIDALNKWMEEGSVDLTVTCVNMLGVPGAGKTCSLHLLLNEEQPTNDTSTPIACPAVRATRVAVSDKRIWKRVTPADLRDKLAANWAADLQQKKKEEPPIPVVCLSPNSSAEIPPDPSPTPPKPSEEVSSESIAIKKDKKYHTLIQEILATQPEDIHISDHWLYIIDSGGQPAYQELLPLFTRAASLNIIALDLSKPFDEKFDLMYRIDGQYFPCHSKSTQLAFFKSAVSTGASFEPLDISCISKKPTHSMHLVLGTHYDKMSDATLIKKKEEILKSSMSSLESYLQNCVIHYKKSIMYPVNTTIASSEERAKYSEEICKAIWYRGSNASLKIKIPIRWFVFELSLPEQSIVSVKEALSIGERYGMNEEDTKQALRYFHDVSLILYYPEVTNVVFIDSKPILEILSQLLALTYVDDDDAVALISDKPLPPKVTNNLKEGFFNEDIFEHLKSKSVIFSLPEFQLSDLIRLLLHLNIITKLEDEPKGHYFIPYALPSYNEPVSIKETNAKPLLLVWKEEKSEEILPVPRGLFPLTIVHLLNQKEYVTKIPPLTPEYYKFRDAMSLKITFTQKHTLHLINRYTHIEVYFTGPTQHCPLVRKLLTTAIDDSSGAMHLKHNYVNAFACPYNESCYCIVNENHHKVADCTVCGESPALSNDYWTWFNDAQGPDENNNGTQIKQVNDQSPDEIKKKLEIVLRENQVTLHDVFMETQETLNYIARSLNAVNIIGKAVQRKPNYESIIGSFINGVKLKDSISDIEEHCVKFLTALSGVGGPVAEASDMIKKKWMNVCTVRLDMTFEGNASKMDDMPSAANAVQMKGHASDKTDLLLDKKPEKNDLLRLFKSSAAHYMIIETALDVEVDDLSHNPEATTIDLIKVFQKWLHSNNDVTWRNIVQVCEDYPDELGKAKANVQEFLLSDRARAKYLK